MKSIFINFRSVKRQKSLQIIFIYIIMVAIIIVANIVQPGFLSTTHMQNLLRTASFLGIAAIGQTLIILTGGIDLSITYVITLCNIVSAQMMNGSDENLLFIIFLVVVIGILVGLTNGIGIHFLKIPPIVMTLALGTVMFGIAYIYSGGTPKGNAAPFIKCVTNELIFGITHGVVLIWAILAVIFIVILNYTVFGRTVFAVGVNPRAARYSGIKVHKVRLIVYIISSVLSAITGMLLVGFTGRSYMTTGSTYNMGTIAAVVLGGTLITGGKGGYVGTIAGVIIMTVISSMMTMINTAKAGRNIVEGLILIVILLIMSLRTKNKD